MKMRINREVEIWSFLSRTIGNTWRVKLLYFAYFRYMHYIQWLPFECLFWNLGSRSNKTGIESFIKQQHRNMITKRDSILFPFKIYMLTPMKYFLFLPFLISHNYFKDEATQCHWEEPWWFCLYLRTKFCLARRKNENISRCLKQPISTHQHPYHQVSFEEDAQCLVMKFLSIQNIHSLSLSHVPRMFTHDPLMKEFMRLQISCLYWEWFDNWRLMHLYCNELVINTFQASIWSGLPKIRIDSTGSSVFSARAVPRILVHGPNRSTSWFQKSTGASAFAV